MQRSAPRLKIGIAVAVLVVGAMYLLLARGQAMLLDLSGLIGMLCF